jgi:regulatory protein
LPLHSEDVRPSPAHRTPAVGISLHRSYLRFVDSVNDSPKKKITDPDLALSKIESWCAYQERCQQEVRDKLYSWGLYSDAVENIISELISRNFLNEERFAVAYAGGKFRMKKWGKQKIKMELKKRRVPEKIIAKALKEIGEDDYGQSLEHTLAKKWNSEKETHPLKKKMKVMRYMLSRGYETDAVSAAISKYTNA